MTNVQNISDGVIHDKLKAHNKNIHDFYDIKGKSMFEKERNRNNHKNDWAYERIHLKMKLFDQIFVEDHEKTSRSPHKYIIMRNVEVVYEMQ